MGSSLGTSTAQMETEDEILSRRCHFRQIQNKAKMLMQTPPELQEGWDVMVYMPSRAEWEAEQEALRQGSKCALADPSSK